MDRKNVATLALGFVTVLVACLACAVAAVAGSSEVEARSNGADVEVLVGESVGGYRDVTRITDHDEGIVCYILGINEAISCLPSRHTAGVPWQ